MKLGYGDRKTSAPQNPQEVVALLSQIMSASINGEIEFEQAKLALNAATRIVDVMQADTRMKMAAHAMRGVISDQQGWVAIEAPAAEVEVKNARAIG